MASIVIFICLTPLSVTQKPKYSISVFLKKDYSILYLSPFSLSLLSVHYRFCIWYVQSLLVRNSRSSMYERMNLNPWNKSFIFCWKMSGEFATPIGRRLYRYFPHGRIIVHKLLAFLLDQIWQYPIFKSSELAYWRPSQFNNISLVSGIGYGFRLNCLFRFLRSLRKRTRFDLGLGWEKDGATHSESFATLRNPSINIRSTYFLNISLCTFGTRYFHEQIVFASSFNLESTRSIFQVPSVPSNNSSIFCNNFSNSLHCVIVKCWH